MLLLALAWLYLAATGFPTGVALLSATGASFSANTWFVLWSGLLLQALALQLLALFAPLYQVAFVVTASVAVIAAVMCRHDLGVLVGRVSALTRLQIVSIGLVACAVAYIAAGPVLLYDSGLYHIQVLRWLVGHGIVWGVGLLDARFGIPSDWFALAAPFDAGPFQGRLATAANGYIVLLVVTQSLFSWERILAGHGSLTDALFGPGFALLIVHALLVDTATSASPDLAVAVLTLLVGGLIAEDAAPGVGARENNPGHCVPIVFVAAMAVAIKLSAAPILAIALLYCLWCVRAAPRPMLMLGIALVAVLGPTFCAGYLMNGCPAFPLAVGCLDLPWRIPAVAAHEFARGVTRFARWYASAPQAGGAFGWTVPYFLHPGNRLNPPLVALATVSAAASIISFARCGAGRREGWIFMLGGSGFGFVMITAPDTRFCIGCIALLFGLAASPIIRRPFWTAYGLRDAFVPLAVVGALAMVVFRVAIVDPIDRRRWSEVQDLNLRESLAERWLEPAPLPVIAGVTRLKGGLVYRLRSLSSADVRYEKPLVGDQCWGAPIPCVPAAPTPLQLRRPDIGIAAGFMRQRPN